MVNGWGLKSYQECLDSFGSDAYDSVGEVYCNATWDKALCWPPTPAGKTVPLPCPPIMPFDRSKFAFRVCGPNGTWEGRPPVPAVKRYDGWTNYNDCYTEMTREFYFRLVYNIPIEQLKMHAFGSRILETIGLMLSFISLVVSTFIFCYFRSIRSSHRIRIHRNLFVSVMVYTLILLIKNIDQMIAHESGKDFVIFDSSIHSKRILCETLIVLVEFTKTAMFSWMLIQGLHLQITLSSVFNATPNYKLYYGLGWGIPITFTIIWATVNGLFNRETCWYAYSYQKYFWVLEAPRLLILFVNLCFLVSVVRMLISKMRSNRSSEKEQIKKAVKAMIFLLPPLGANNLLQCIWPPISSQILFALHCYSANFFSSFQGFFMALFFCFLNSEVKNTVRVQWIRSWHNRFSVCSAQGSGTKLASANVTSLSEITTNECKDKRSSVVFTEYLLEHQQSV